MQDLENLMRGARQEVAESDDLQGLDRVRVRFLGKKGELTQRLKQLGSLPAADRPTAGQAINRAKQELGELIEVRREELQRTRLADDLAAEALDVTQPGRGQLPGGLHPVTRTLERIEALFRQAGFEVHEGPEIEDDYHNFEALNIPAEHPARAMHDTF